jgi:hypothetical protein
MPPNFEPSTPVEAYKAIIDQLVEETTPGVSERLLRESGVYSKAPGDVAANEFVKSLTVEQRLLLADMLHRERMGAIGGTLAVLTWWLLCRDVGLTFRGQPMPFELSGEGLHGDYIGRLDDWQWPKDGGPAGA